MFIPAAFREDDLDRLWGLMEENEFALLVTVAGGLPFASHVPFLLDRSRGEQGMLRGHLARANPQGEHLAEGKEALVVFGGPHAYISPNWYTHHPAVPTWNYAVVHAYGTPRLLDEAAILALLRDTTNAYERGPGWTFDSLPAEYVQKMARGVVGFDLPLTRLEGKFKLSQNRPEDDQVHVAEHLAGGDAPAQATARLMWEKPLWSAGDV